VYLDALKAARRTRRPGSVEVEPDSEVLVDCMLDGDALKQHTLGTLQAFWDGFYRERFEADLPGLEASVASQRRQAYPADLAGLLLGVTGRAVPDVMARQMDGVECVEFVPNLHIGPYLVFTPAPPRMLVAYNALGRAPFPEPPFERYPVAHRLLPVLDALADETRLSVLELLRTREMYAQEIAQAVGLSQSAISRHLRQLEEAGLVRVRRAGTMKHYSLDAGCGQTLLASLRELLGVP
jgi:DNA-binding transcriptional ArsR family regulator